MEVSELEVGQRVRFWDANVDVFYQGTVTEISGAWLRMQPWRVEDGIVHEADGLFWRSDIRDLSRLDESPLGIESVREGDHITFDANGDSWEVYVSEVREASIYTNRWKREQADDFHLMRGGWDKDQITNVVWVDDDKERDMDEQSVPTTTDEVITRFVELVLDHGGCGDGKAAILGCLASPTRIERGDHIEDVWSTLRANLEWQQEHGDVADFTKEGIDRLMVKLGGKVEVPKPDVTVVLPRDLFDALYNQVGHESINWGGQLTNGEPVGRALYNLLGQVEISDR